jgi:hypothetical protein
VPYPCGSARGRSWAISHRWPPGSAKHAVLTPHCGRADQPIGLLDLQEVDARVAEAEHRRVVVLPVDREPENVSIERLRHAEILDE